MTYFAGGRVYAIHAEPYTPGYAEPLAPCPRCGALGWVFPCSECGYPREPELDAVPYPDTRAPDFGVDWTRLREIRDERLARERGEQ